jgi:uncharacterized protein (DUF2235 family)
MLEQGLYENIRAAYSFICHNYTGPDNEIFLIGFSRGAFTARCIAQFIHDVGLLTKESLLYLLPLFDAWKDSMTGEMKESRDTKSIFEMAGLESPVILERQEQLHLNVRITACAVWDTVSALGLPMLGGLPQPAPRKLKFVNSELCPNIENAFQALALHEHRRPFRPIPWSAPKGTHQKLKQCWFLGFHGDVGGSGNAPALSHLSLVWMMAQLRPFLNFKISNLWTLVRGIEKPFGGWASHQRTIHKELDVPGLLNVRWRWETFGKSATGKTNDGHCSSCSH